MGSEPASIPRISSGLTPVATSLPDSRGELFIETSRPRLKQSEGAGRALRKRGIAWKPKEH